jgi:hypothetical protein
MAEGRGGSVEPRWLDERTSAEPGMEHHRCLEDMPSFVALQIQYLIQ